MTILIVEDNARVRRLIRHAVAGIASEIWECPDGADAAAEYTARRPDAVLMDVRMPRMDGLVATRRIRAIDPAARVVIVTDYDEDALRAAAKAAGASGYALKQDLSALPQVLGTILS